MTNIAALTRKNTQSNTLNFGSKLLPFFRWNR